MNAPGSSTSVAFLSTQEWMADMGIEIEGQLVVADWRIVTNDNTVDERYYLIRPVGRHPARGSIYLPTIAFRRDGGWYQAMDHIEPIIFGNFNSETGEIDPVDLEFIEIPGYSDEDLGV
jgi:hypothetical protein